MMLILAFLLAVSGTDADSAYAAQHYSEAAVLYADVVKAQPSNAQAWYRLGVSDVAIGRAGEGKAALEKALALGYDAMSVHYRLAIIAARAGDASETVSQLRAAIKARPIPAAAIAQDPAFSGVSSNPQFAAFMEEQNRASYPCRYDTAYRALDFWIGDWSVTSGAGAAGKSHIESAADGCAIVEQWNGAYGAPGKSISAYDAGTEHWTQRYVSGRGTITDYVGTVLADSSVQFVSGSGNSQTRMTYTRLPDGSVRQRFETSTDGGRTWSTPSDLIYKRAT